MMNTTISKKKKVDFYSDFNLIVDSIKNINSSFTIFISNDNQQSLNVQIEKIKELRIACQQSVSLLKQNLYKSYFTPFYREDIYDLANSLNYLGDFIYTICRQRINYNIATLTSAFVEITNSFTNYVNQLEKIVNSLSDVRHLGSLTTACVSMKKEADLGFKLAENEHDKLLRENIEAVELIKILSLYHNLMELFKRSKSIGHVLDNIIIKYS